MRGRLLLRGGFPRWVRVLGGLAGVLALVVMSLELPPVSSPPVARAADAGGSVTVKHTFTGGADASGQRKTYNGEVSVSQTQNLQPRQVINVDWKGFEPSRGFGNNESLNRGTEYPVVMVLCWGADVPSAPLEPTHCQGPPNTVALGHGLYGPWQYAMTNDSDGSQRGPRNPQPPDVKGTRAGPDTLGFTAVDGTHYSMWDQFHNPGAVPPSLQDGGDALPSNAMLTFSDSKGARSNVPFEVRGSTDLPVLGCAYQSSPSAPGACTLEVIPIVQPWCNPNPNSKPPVPKYYAQQCKAGPNNAVGPDQGYGNTYLTADNWWLTTQWEHRFAFPLSMAPQPGDCASVDQRPSLAIAGSEAAVPVLASWSTQFCLDPRRAFKFSLNAVPEDTARRNLAGNGGVDAAVTALPVTGSSRPVVHAPIAATGWTVAYELNQHEDRNLNPGPLYKDLTLSPLLLAKLMTSSYRFGADHEPALAGNPDRLFDDPEFKALNPTFTPMQGQVFPQVVWVSPTPEDSFAAMFAYIDADPEARAWLNGKPDAYSSMVVNPAYRSLAAPQMAVQYLDGWVNHYPPGHGTADCETKSPIPWYTEVAQTAQSLDTTALAVLNRKPPSLTCAGNGTSEPFHWSGNKISQPITQQQIIAFTTVPLAQKYGLSMAKLQSPRVPGAKSVAPSGWENYGSTYSTMEAALGYTKQDKDTGVTSLDFSTLPFNAAYPGTMPIYAAVPVAGLDKTMAGYYADWLEFAANAGQTPGTNPGQLPPGYTPLPQAYRQYTLEAARHVRAQDGVVPTPPADLGGQVRGDLGLPAPGSPDATSGSGFAPALGGGPAGGGGGGAAPAGAAPGGGVSPSAGSRPSSAAHRPGMVAATRGTDSWLAGWGLAILLGLGLLAGVAVPLIQISAQPGHPVRRFFAGMPQLAGRAVTRSRAPRDGGS